MRSCTSPGVRSSIGTLTSSWRRRPARVQACGIPTKLVWRMFLFSAPTAIFGLDRLSTGGSFETWLASPGRGLRGSWLHGTRRGTRRAKSIRKESDAMKTALEDHLHAAGVDVVLNGHVHAYERTFPVFNGIVDMCSGTVHITIGDGGNRECFADYDLSPGHPWFQYNWSAIKRFSFGHGRLRLRNATHAEWEFFANEKYPEVHDHAWLVRGDVRDAMCAASAIV